MDVLGASPRRGGGPKGRAFVTLQLDSTRMNDDHSRAVPVPAFKCVFIKETGLLLLINPLLKLNDQFE